MDQQRNGSAFAGESNRVRLSRLILVALVREKEMSATDVVEPLRQLVNQAREGHPEFIFDLGWGENIRTTYEALANLGWVAAEEHSERRYRATPIGISHLQDYEADLETLLGNGSLR